MKDNNYKLEAAVWGGAGEHGRSCYFLKQDGLSVLLDCGVKKEGAGSYPLLLEEDVAELQAVFLSHAHEDHSMAIPFLYKLGYTGKVWMTRATAEQLPSYFTSWRNYVESHSAELPYQEEHIGSIRIAYLDEEVPPGEWLDIMPGLRVLWGKSGHLLGSVWLLLDMEGVLVFFSGDYSVESYLLTADWPSNFPVPSQRKVELSLIDAAYGIETEKQEAKLACLEKLAQTTFLQDGKLLLPVPPFGRGQDLLLWLTITFPDIRVMAEKEIADALEQMLHWTDWLKPGAERSIRELLEDNRICVAANPAERQAFLAQEGPCAILTVDGMMQSALAQWYYNKLRSNGRNTVILTGHLAPGSFARRLLEEGADAECRVEWIRYKVHQGINDARRMIDALDSTYTVLVHGKKSLTDEVAAVLAGERYQGIHSLSPGDSILITD
ncbi:MBL fold metallo-hydrolase [Paenibacillus filicis]|uniref:MBL fold metallo-hydrolase n=1 Tax=Paenibacillus gyeongsangnamensis TaxID=3388067 RepID=A0ABT4Q4Z2_9BACL|nr:MBL fold metallo-hydrolase [Paenibacillus filicis]MCZ8511923.1 MBL fold metallo-hydrolase [Paenibacillus filicis]